MQSSCCLQLLDRDCSHCICHHAQGLVLDLGQLVSVAFGCCTGRGHAVLQNWADSANVELFQHCLVCTPFCAGEFFFIRPSRCFALAWEFWIWFLQVSRRSRATPSYVGESTALRVWPLISSFTFRSLLEREKMMYVVFGVFIFTSHELVHASISLRASCIL